MKKYLLPENGSFYKANLHCHTTVSDGKKTPEEIKELYKSLGYSIVAYTDHDVFVPHHEELTDENFIALNGFEIQVNDDSEEVKKKRKCCHFCFIALEPDNALHPLWHRTLYAWGNCKEYRHLVKCADDDPDYIRVYSSEGITDMLTRGRERGFFVTYNHPTWSLESYPEYMGYKNMNAIEMFNGSCLSMGYNDYNPRVYDDILRGGQRVYCIGADDNHNKSPHPSRNSDSAVAFTMIKAPRLEYRTITKALEDGHFYASEGPEIYELTYEDGRVHIKCSEADRIFCSYGVRRAAIAYADEGGSITEADFSVAEDCIYFRITVVDKAGRHACTNAYFVNELV